MLHDFEAPLMYKLECLSNDFGGGRGTKVTSFVSAEEYKASQKNSATSHVCYFNQMRASRKQMEVMVITKNIPSDCMYHSQFNQRIILVATKV